MEDGRARAEDDVRLAVEDGLKHGREFLRAVLEIGVLDRDDVAGRHRESGVERGPLAAIDFMAFELESARFPRLKAFPGLVRGVVVDGDVFQLDSFLKTNGADTFEDGIDVSFLVVDGDHDRKFEFVRHVLSKKLKTARLPDFRSVQGVIICFLR